MKGPLEADEKLAAALGRATGAWSHIEYLLTILFCVVTKLDLHMAAGIFDFFKSTRTQGDVLKRVAKLSTVATDDQREFLATLLKEYEGLAQRRNEVAHNPYGWTDETNTNVYLMLKTKGTPTEEGIPYKTRTIEAKELDKLTSDIDALRLKVVALLWAVGKLPPLPQSNPLPQ